MPDRARPGTGERAEQLAPGQPREAILHGETASAQRLVENELAERFGVPRAGIRAALIEPGSQGLVERIRDRGSRVRAVTVEEAVAITECRPVPGGLRTGHGQGRRRHGGLHRGRRHHPVHPSPTARTPSAAHLRPRATVYMRYC